MEMGIQGSNAHRALAHFPAELEDEQVQMPSPANLSLGALQALASEMSCSPPKHHAELKDARAQLAKKCSEEHVAALRFAQFTNKLAMEDLEFLKSSKDCYGKLSVVKQLKTGLPSVGLVVAPLVFHDFKNRAMVRTVGYRIFDIAMDNFIYRSHAEVEMLLHHLANFEGQISSWNLPESMCINFEKKTTFASHAQIKAYLQDAGVIPSDSRQRLISQLFTHLSTQCMQHTEAALKAKPAAHTHADAQGHACEHCQCPCQRRCR